MPVEIGSGQTEGLVLNFLLICKNLKLTDAKLVI
jgi:hypothetical protein